MRHPADDTPERIAYDEGRVDGIEEGEKREGARWAGRVKLVEARASLAADILAGNRDDLLEA